MTFPGWISKKELEDYEQVLESLALDIQKRQTCLSEIRLRERRTTLLTDYAFAFWVACVGAWFAGLLPHVSGMHFEHTVKAVPSFIGLIIIQFSRRIVQTWYARIGDAEEKALKALLATCQGGDARASPSGKLDSEIPKNRLVTGVCALPSNAQLPRWYDKVADALLGDDELSASAAARRRVTVWEDSQYVCPKCGHYNPSVRSEGQPHRRRRTSRRHNPSVSQGPAHASRRRSAARCSIPRKSMPALQLLAVDDDEPQPFVRGSARLASLSSTVILVEDNEESEGEDDTSFTNWEEEEDPKRVPLAEGDL